MATKSSIEWTESTWNPVTGCSKISPGCKHCYAERMARRLHAMGQPSYRNGFNPTAQPQMLETPLRWKKPQIVFVNSMSDLFHEDVQEDFILEIFEAMNQADWHTYQILTKRPDRLVALDPKLPWRPHIWMGVSVENQQYTKRIELLRHSHAHIKFLSLEPLLGPIHKINLEGIDWVIVGGESGPGSRPIEKSWVIEIRDLCIRKNVPFFFKQWGGFHKKRAGRLLEGRTWDQTPIQTRHL
ncbi:phage Gp37/Gp68 family protein [bacterium]|nr:phage Gp37/Gp68 family protein [bacterium]